MGIFGGNYSKPGPGVSKNECKKKGLARFYQIFLRKFWDLIKLNLLYILTLLPTFAVVFVLAGMISNQFGTAPENMVSLSQNAFSIEQAQIFSITTDSLIRFYVAALFCILWGGGPATAGFVYILRSFLWEEPVFIASDYFKHVKSNFRQAITVWIIDIPVFTALCNGYFFYGRMPGIMMNLKYAVLVIGFFYTMLHLYIYHLLVTYKLKIKELYRNSALFSLCALPFSVLTILAVAFIVLIWPAIAFTALNEKLATFFIIAVFVLLVTLIFSACGLYIENNAISQIKKYIKEDADVRRNE